MTGVFVSHAHSDEPLVRALAAMLERLFGPKIGAVNYSSRKESSGGIEPGEEWFGWIVNQVQNADFVLLMLTPNSVAKPWVIWEAGAAAGAALSLAEGTRPRPLIPLVYGMDSSTVPGPMSRLQTVRGGQEADIRKLVDRIYSHYEDRFTASEARDFGRAQDPAIRDYTLAVEAILPRLPISVTEAAIQEWIDRLDDLKRQGRFAETRVYEQWINVAFGRSNDKSEPPLDLRIHRRLAALLDAAGEGGWVDAERQYEFARRAAPRDIFTLRGLGKIKLDRGDLAGCKAVIDEIESLDKGAFLSNPENAALKARWQKRSGDELGRLAFLRDAYRTMPGSFYIGDLLGQSLVARDELAEARQVYAQVLERLEHDREDSIWSRATAATAELVLGDAAALGPALDAIEAKSPSRGQRESISRGLAEVAAHLPADDRARQVLLDRGWLAAGDGA